MNPTNYKKRLYTEEDHKRAFLLWREHKHNFTQVARDPSMPARQNLNNWSGMYPSCKCPWHNWHELERKIRAGIEIEKFREVHPKPLDNKEVASLETEFKEELQKYLELIKADVKRLNFLKSWWAYVQRFMTISIQREIDAWRFAPDGDIFRIPDNMVSDFRPKNIKEAVQVLAFIFEEEEKLIGNRKPIAALLENRPGATVAEQQNLSPLPLSALQEDELMQLLGQAYLLADQVREEERVNNVINIATGKSS